MLREQQLLGGVQNSMDNLYKSILSPMANCASQIHGLWLQQFNHRACTMSINMLMVRFISLPRDMSYWRWHNSSQPFACGSMAILSLQAMQYIYSFFGLPKMCITFFGRSFELVGMMHCISWWNLQHCTNWMLTYRVCPTAKSPKISFQDFLMREGNTYSWSIPSYPNSIIRCGPSLSKQMHFT